MTSKRIMTHLFFGDWICFAFVIFLNIFFYKKKTTFRKNQVRSHTERGFYSPFKWNNLSWKIIRSGHLEFFKIVDKICWLLFLCKRPVGDTRHYFLHMALHSDVHLQRILVDMCRLHFRRTLCRSRSHGNHRYGKHKIWLEKKITFKYEKRIGLCI